MHALETATVADAMTADVLKVPEHWSLHSLIGFFNTHRISGAPVIDNHARLTGVVSLSDILRFDSSAQHSIEENPLTQYYYSGLEGMTPEQLGLTGGDQHGQHLVSEIMTPHIIALDQQATLQEAVDLMCQNRIHRVFVTRQGELAGVVTTLDILDHLRR
ncbi:CBS domain-containing protein [Marinobacterium rhizophilum]|uniref:CBS domain-containing protein n=1 Tax=Marinobacterium rhizophilum TaxID=420402 RepID=A0ABY5HF56_9GAMM|nr:CBS domain-containing protein [Marinobacterium rhizophilum]UTW10915.1 CBS domain-containing protein [Marinobacterium rhizophilum]